MGKGVWGIDVSKSSVKAVRIEGGTLTHAGVFPYESAGSGEAGDLDEQIRTALGQIKSTYKITSEPVIEVAQVLLHIMLWSCVIFGMQAALSGIMRASGSVLVPTLISILCIGLVELPTAYFMSHRIGLNGVWISYPVAFSAMLLLQATYYRLVWRKKAIKRLV